MNTQMLTKVFGAVFVLIGVLGFVPGITANGMLLGIFEVDALHSSVHVLTGIVALVAVKMGKERLFLQAFGVVYALVAVLGFVMGGNVLGLFHANMADNLLHLVVAGAFLYGGFMMGSGHKAAPVPEASHDMQHTDDTHADAMDAMSATQDNMDERAESDQMR